MSKKQNFVSSGLYALREKHREQNTIITNSNQTPVIEPKKDFAVEKKTTVSASKKEISLNNKRLNEILKSKQELKLTLHQSIGAMKEQSILLQKNLGQANNLTQEMENILISIEKLNNSEDDITTTERELEHIKIELYKRKTKIDTLLGCLNTTNDTGNTTSMSLLPELNSLNQIQMFKMGLCFALPLIAAIIFGCFVVAWAISSSMGGS